VQHQEVAQGREGLGVRSQTGIQLGEERPRRGVRVERVKVREEVADGVLRAGREGDEALVRGDVALVVRQQALVQLSRALKLLDGLELEAQQQVGAGRLGELGLQRAQLELGKGMSAGKKEESS
jgi:hypothetical protein